MEHDLLDKINEIVERIEEDGSLPDDKELEELGIKNLTIVQVLSEEKEKNGQKWFNHYFNNGGRRDRLKFNSQKSQKVNFKNGGLKWLLVIDINKDKKSFYPQYWATIFKELNRAEVELLKGLMFSEKD